MKILLCAVPDGSLENTVEPRLVPFGSVDVSGYYLFSPLGALRVATYAEHNGYDVEIYDINSLRAADEVLKENLRKINPTVVGLSGPLTHCYPNIKRVAKIVRDLFPDAWIITGGAITGSSNVILAKTETDICVVGDGEIPFLKLLKYIETHPTNKDFDYEKLLEIPGLAYIDENKKLQVNGNAEALSAADASGVHYPDYDKLRDGLQKHLGDGNLIHRFFGTIDDLPLFTETILEQKVYPEGLEVFNKYIGFKIGQIMSAQGCVARCTFCQRYLKGYRPYKTSDFESHLIELKEKYNVRVVMLADDNSLSDKKQGYAMARILKKHGIYWSAGGVRATTCSFEDLKFYKEHGLLAIRFGIESGSQRILDIMEKKIKKEDPYNALLYCSKLQISTATDMFLLGMPGETFESVAETAEYSGKLRYMVGKDWNIGNTTLAMSIPGTPLYEYSQQVGVIGKTLEEEEDYLIRTSELPNKDILCYVNKTDFSIEEVNYWTYYYRYAAKKTFIKEIFKSKKSLKNKFLEFYNKCLKASALRVDNYYKQKGYKRTFAKRFSQSFLQLMLTFSILLVPNFIFFKLLRMYANQKFKKLKEANYVKNGKQKHNCFVGPSIKPDKNFKITEEYIKKSTRSSELSLRTIVMANRKKLDAAITNEEKGLQILAQGQ